MTQKDFDNLQIGDTVMLYNDQCNWIVIGFDTAVNKPIIAKEMTLLFADVCELVEKGEVK
jgi:hypothetical protein